MKHTFTYLFIGLIFFSHNTHADYEIKGSTTNYVMKNYDGLVDFSLVMPAMSQEQVINFDLARVISPATDSIQIASYTIDLPSNLSLPQQAESYFITINFNKPEFRVYVQDEDIYNFYALYGRFPLKDMIKGYQGGKSIFELVDIFDFQGGGVKSVPVKGNVSGLSLTVDQMTFDDSYQVKAPTYPKDKVAVIFSLMSQTNQFYPTDMKKVASGQTAKLAKKSGATHWNLALLMNSTTRTLRETFDGHILSAALGAFSSRTASPLAQVSYTLSPATSANLPTFLPMIPAPTFDKTKWTLQSKAPVAPAGTSIYAVTLTLSEVTTGGTASFPIDFKKPLWSTQAMNWSENFQIPDAVKQLIVAKKQYSWDIAYLAVQTPATDSSIDWQKVTHVTRNSVKF